MTSFNLTLIIINAVAKLFKQILSCLSFTYCLHPTEVICHTAVNLKNQQKKSVNVLKHMKMNAYVTQKAINYFGR